MHHPTNWLQAAEEKQLRARLENEFDFFLHWHEHDAWVKPGSIAPHHTISAGAATAETAGEFGYNFVQIDATACKVYLRHYDASGGGWVERPISGRAPGGIWPLPVPQHMRAKFAAATTDVGSAAVAPPNALAEIILPTVAPTYEGFVTSTTDATSLAQQIFGSFSSKTRYTGSPSKAHYFERQTDQQLDALLAGRDWVLIEGHPLAGKTRAVFEAFKRLLANESSLAIWPFKQTAAGGGVALPPLRLPTFPPAARYCIVWMDDIDQTLHNLKTTGYAVAAINQFLQAMADADMVLVGTARTGPQNYTFQHRFGLNDHLWDKVSTLRIDKLAGAEAQEFATWYDNHFASSLPDKFEHQPGSLFLDLKAMKDRWTRMAEFAKDAHASINVAYAKDLLRALHVFYVMQAYRPGGVFKAADVLLYLERKAAHQTAKYSVGNAFATAFNKAAATIGTEWGDLIEFLAQDRYHLGFIHAAAVLGEACLQIETAYLDHITGEDADKNIVMTVCNTLTLEERQKLGLMVSPYDYSSVVQEKPIRDENELDRLIRNLKHLGLEREIVVWNQILHHCTTLALARKAMAALHKAGLQSDVFTWSSLISKTANRDEAQTILAEMRNANITPNVITYNSLLTKATTLTEGVLVLQQISTARHRPDKFTYTPLFKQAQTWQEIERVWQEMQSDKVQFNKFHLNAVRRKLQNAPQPEADLLLAHPSRA